MDKAIVAEFVAREKGNKKLNIISLQPGVSIKPRPGITMNHSGHQA
jgi:hypothetical protein